MKKLLTLLLISYSSVMIAQPTTGLVAHWDMNGTTNDVSGAGHNGHGNNLAAAAGADGVMGHAWYFNGVNSSITIPASPAFNVNNYTIVARVNVKGFNAGTCHINTIFMRGRTSGSGGGDWYHLEFSDAPAGYGCSPGIDSSQESFLSYGWSAGGGLLPSSLTSFNYTPHIAKDVWYTVVATFNDTVYKVYVNNVLKSTAYITSPGVPIGTGADSAYIGLDFMEVSTGYSYPFKGDIDEIYLYNRVLADTETVQFYDTCGAITLQPVSSTLPVGGTATYTVNTAISGAVYQWQQNTGSGFTNLSNTLPYSGVTTNTLTITGVTSAMSGYTYRCILSNFSGCADTSATASLTDTCSIVTLQPVSATVHPGGTATYTVNTASGTTYQWQQNAGTGFANLSNTPPYSGVNTNTLTVTGVTPAMSGYTYRCALSNTTGCVDTSSTASLTLGINDIAAHNIVSIYPNPVTNKLNITATSPITSITISNLLGQVLRNDEFYAQKVQVDVADLPAGVYMIKVNGSVVRKFVKQ